MNAIQDVDKVEGMNEIQDLDVAENMIAHLRFVTYLIFKY